MIAHSLMIHEQVLEAYINFALMYTADNIFLVIPIRDLINEDSDPTRPSKLATGMKPSILLLHVLFFTCAVWKAISHVGTKVLNMNHQAQQCFHVIFFGISQHQKGYIVYVPHKRKIESLSNVVFVESFSSDLLYK